MRETLRQKITHREYKRGRVTQQSLARRFGVTQSAISKRLARRRARLAKENPIIEYAPLSSILPKQLRSVQSSALSGLF